MMATEKLSYCNKRRFAKRASALQRITEIALKGEVRDKTPIRAYYCSVCGGYHLTSSDLKTKDLNRIVRRKEHKPEKVAEDWITKKHW